MVKLTLNVALPAVGIVLAALVQHVILKPEECAGGRLAFAMARG
jgi:hypothetical protein